MIYPGAPLPAVHPEFARVLHPKVAKPRPSITGFQCDDRCDRGDRCCDMLKVKRLTELHATKPTLR